MRISLALTVGVVVWTAGLAEVARSQSSGSGMTGTPLPPPRPAVDRVRPAEVDRSMGSSGNTSRAIQDNFQIQRRGGFVGSDSSDLSSRVLSGVMGSSGGASSDRKHWFVGRRDYASGSSGGGSYGSGSYGSGSYGSAPTVVLRAVMAAVRAAATAAVYGSSYGSSYGGGYGGSSNRYGSRFGRLRRFVEPLRGGYGGSSRGGVWFAATADMADVGHVGDEFERPSPHPDWQRLSSPVLTAGPQPRSPRRSLARGK